MVSEHPTVGTPSSPGPNTLLAALTAPTADRAITEARASLSSSPGISPPSAPGWQQTNALTGPPSRSGATEVYDPALGMVVLFGGKDGPTYLSDTWEYHLSPIGAGFWRDVSPPASPESRAYAGAAFDESTGQVVVFGGVDGSVALNSTWAFDGYTWRNLSVGGAPPLVGPGMTYDPQTGGLLLFGGLANGTYESTLYQLVGSRWVPQSPTGAPQGRSGATFLYDDARAAVVLADGRDAAGPLADTWELQGGGWTMLSNVGAAPPVSGASSVVDAADGTLLVVGGNGSTGPTSLSYELPTDAGWSRVPLPSELPGRTDASAAFDEALGQTLLFGGWNGSARNDTWLFSLARTTPSWRTLPASAEPPRRSEAALAYDPVDGYVLLYGGLVHGAVGNGTGGDLPKAGGNPVSTNFLGDTWAFRNGTWTNLTPHLAPSPRRAPMMAFDGRDGYMVLFGGSNGTSYLNDTWSFRGGVWTRLHPLVAPPSRRAGGMTFDAADAEILLFGGHSGSVTQTNYTFYSDLWAFAGGVWTQVHPSTTGSENPPAMAQPMWTYDPASGYTVLFGGFRPLNPDGTGEDALNYTYTFQGGAWTNLSGTTAWHSPSPRDGAAFVFDEATATLETWGGENLAAGPTDQWSYQAGAWTQRCTKCVPAGEADNPGTWDPQLAGAFTWGANPGPGTSIESVFVAPFTLVSTRLLPVVDAGAPVGYFAQAQGGVQPWTAQWNFGDSNSTTTGWNVSHSYSGTGQFRMNLTAFDGLGMRWNFSENVTVNSSLQLTFRDSLWGPYLNGARMIASVLNGAPPYRYSINFGDGNFLNGSSSRSNSIVAKHRYQNGTFTPSLTITDGGGGSQTLSASALTLPATAPKLAVTSNRTVVAVPGIFDLTSMIQDAYGGTNYTWSSNGSATGSFASPTSPTTVFRTHSAGLIRVTVRSVDAVNLTTSASINLTVVPVLTPSFNIQVPNKITCPVTPGSTTVTLNATVSGGEAPYTYFWNWSNSNLTGPGVIVPMTPGQSQTVQLTISDAAGDNASVSRSVLVPPATCGPGLSLPEVTNKLLLEIAIGIIAGLVLIEAVVLIRNRRRTRPPPTPVDD